RPCTSSATARSRRRRRLCSRRWCRRRTCWRLRWDRLPEMGRHEGEPHQMHPPLDADAAAGRTRRPAGPAAAGGQVCRAPGRVGPFSVGRGCAACCDSDREGAVMEDVYIFIMEDGEMGYGHAPPSESDMAAVNDGLLSVIRVSDGWVHEVDSDGEWHAM